jgi:hypothetical protein
MCWKSEEGEGEFKAQIVILITYIIKNKIGTTEYCDNSHTNNSLKLNKKL